MGRLGFPGRGGNDLIDERPVGAALNRDISRGEVVDADLDKLISRRHDARVAEEGERDLEEAWCESERRAEAARKAEEDRDRIAWARHLQLVYQRRTAEYGRLVEVLESDF
jgi:hypothetical protein